MLNAEIREAAKDTSGDINKISQILSSETMEGDDLLVAIELLENAKKQLHILVEEVQEIQ